MQRDAEIAAWETLLQDRDWRLSHLYRIIDNEGHEIEFVPNATQRELLADSHNRKLVLKSRRHGITTLACLQALDIALFRSNTTCGIVMHKREDAEKVFVQKILFAYDRLPEWLRKARPIKTRDNTGKIEFANGSRIAVSLSHRGGTLQFLHVSEYGPMVAMFPQRAAEVKTGALNTVSTDCLVTIESTSYGGFGDFYDMCKVATDHEALVNAGQASWTPLDYKLHFFAWWRDQRNVLDPEGVVVTKEDTDYFTEIESEVGVKLAPEQRAWYVKKRSEQGEAMLREHPSTADEAFRGSIEGAYYTLQMRQARGDGRIGVVPHVAGEPVNTFWDLGFNDAAAIWFHQEVALANRFIRSYSATGEYLQHYTRYLQTMADKHGYVYGTHFLPHDAENNSMASRSVKSLLEAALPGQRFETVPRIANQWLGIQMVRQVFTTCWFDAVNCADGLRAMDAYRKHYDAKHGIFTSDPEHDESSNLADAFRQFAQGYAPVRRTVERPAWQDRLHTLQRQHRRGRGAMLA